MTNLDSVFKSRDITLSTKVHLVKAVVFPVVMYGCESWTIKKAEQRKPEVPASPRDEALFHCEPGESQGWGSLVGCCLWGHTELDMTEVT